MFLKKQLNKTPIVPMQPESYQRILAKVQDLYQNNPVMNAIIDEVFTDAKQIFYDAMQKSIIQNALITPDVKGLKEEYHGTPKKDPEYAFNFIS